MKKRGFTLIEMMSVIIILAVIALIVTPLVIGSIKDSKQKLYDTQIENIVSAAKSYMIDLDLEDNETITLTLNDLKKTGKVKKDIKNPKTGEEFNECMMVTVTKMGESYDYKVTEEESLNCETNNNIIMVLIGSINEIANKNKEYIEPGVIVKKDNGQSLDSSKIKVEVTKKKNGEVIDTKQGIYEELKTLVDTSDYYEYEIKYTYDKEEGLVSKTRKVTVKDANNLQCIILPTSGEKVNGWITKNRQAKILSINSNKKVEYSLSTTNTKNYGKNQLIDINKDGEVNIYGYIKDEDGNEGACTTKIKYEYGNPSCNIELEGEKANSGWYQSDVKATLITNIISPIRYYGMNNVNSKIYNSQNEMNLNSSGSVYGYMEDIVLKEASCFSKVNIDKTTSIGVSIKGVLQGTSTAYTSGTTVTSNVTLNGTVTPGTTASGYNYQWYKNNSIIRGATSINYTASTSGNYYLVVTTGSGKVGISNTITVNIDDRQRPTCSLRVTSGTAGKNGWYTSNVVVGMSKSDATYYGTTTSSIADYNYKTSESFTSSGVAYCYVGSETLKYTNLNSLGVSIDKTAPENLQLTGFVKESETQQTYNATVTVSKTLQITATAKDPESGIDYYSLSGQGNSSSGVWTVSASGGDYTVTAYNKAGLSSTATLTETCSKKNSSSCNNGTQYDYYECTGTGRTYMTTSTCTMPTTTTNTDNGGSSCGTINCPSGTYQSGCTCVSNTKSCVSISCPGQRVCTDSSGCSYCCGSIDGVWDTADSSQGKHEEPDEIG